LRTQISALALACSLALTGAACSDDAEDDARDTATSLQEEAEDAATSIQDEAEDAASSASSAVDEGAQDAVEAVARNLASEHGEDEFEDSGNELDGDLTCEADASGEDDAVEITCSGTTRSGGAAELTGTTSERPGASATELEGDFVGTVDGEEVFATDRLGDDT
jgi:hypothetical protein